MQCPKSIGSIVLAAPMTVTLAAANAYEDAHYPDWKGQWARIGGGAFDPAKPAGRRQQPPLTAEYQAIWELNMAEEAAGGQDYNPQVRCLPGGMPRLMIAYEPMEVIVTPETTYIRVQFNSGLRRIYTDGRDWPAAMTPTFFGYSIGRWIDEDGDGRYDMLEVETRAMKGRASTTRAASPCTRTTRPSSRSASISTRPIRTCCVTRSPPSTMP